MSEIRPRAFKPRQQTGLRATKGPAVRDPVQFGPGYFVQPNTAGARVDTPHHSDFDLANGFDIRVLAQINGTAGWDTLISKGDVPANVVSSWVIFKVDATTQLRVQWRDSGGGSNFMTSDTGLVLVGSPRWYRVVLLPNTTVMFFYSDQLPSTQPDRVLWTQHGTTQTAAVSSIRATTTDVWLGDQLNEGDTLDGKIYYAEVRNGYEGGIVAAPDFRWRTDYNEGQGFVKINGKSGGVSTPDHLDFDITGDIQIIVGCSFDRALRNDDDDNILTKGNIGTATGSFDFRRVIGSRILQFRWRESGGTERTLSFTSSTPAVDGQFRWYKMEFTASTATGNLYWADASPVSTPIANLVWTLEKTDTDSVATNINSSTADVWIGNRADQPGFDVMEGKVYYAEVIGGTMVANAEFRSEVQMDTQTQLTDDIAKVWTINSPAVWWSAPRKLVDIRGKVWTIRTGGYWVLPLQVAEKIEVPFQPYLSPQTRLVAVRYRP